MSNLSRLISKVVGGGTPSRAVDSYWAGVIPWASVKDISGSQRYLTDTEEHISSEGLKSSSCTLIPAGVPIIATRMAVGAVTIPTIPTGINQDLKGLFLNSDVDPIFARYLISHLQEKISSVSVGSTVKGINVQDLLKIEIPEPPDLKSQQIIAQILTAIDEQIESTEKLIEKKKNVKSGLFYQLLGELQFRTIELGQFCRIEIGGTPSRANEEYWSVSNDGHPWVSIADLKSNIINFTKESITEKAVSVSNVKPLKAGTLMMSFKLTLGKVAIAGVDLYTNEAIAAMYPDATCRSMWLYYLLPHVVKNSVSETAVKGATLNKQSMANLRVPIPDADSQDKFIKLMTLCDADIKNEITCLEKLRVQKQGLMQDLLTGRVRVN